MWVQCARFRFGFGAWRLALLSIILNVGSAWPKRWRTSPHEATPYIDAYMVPKDRVALFFFLGNVLGDEIPRTWRQLCIQTLAPLFCEIFEA